jgi:hypothetical protein
LPDTWRLEEVAALEVEVIIVRFVIVDVALLITNPPVRVERPVTPKVLERVAAPERVVAPVRVETPVTLNAPPKAAGPVISKAPAVVVATPAPRPSVV